MKNSNLFLILSFLSFIAAGSSVFAKDNELHKSQNTVKVREINQNTEEFSRKNLTGKAIR